MKGMELPIGIIVVIVIALIVLIGVATFFNVSLNQGKESLSAQQKWQNACSALKMRGDGKCPVATLESMQIGIEITTLCSEIAGTDVMEECCRVCCGADPEVCR